LVTTGWGSGNGGYVNVFVDRGDGYFPVTFSTLHSNGDIVVDQCYDKLINVQVNSQNSNAWTGNIELSTDRKVSYFPFECAYCTGRTNSMHIVVDGDGSGTYQATTWCIGGATCTMKVRECLSSHMLLDIAITDDLTLLSQPTIIFPQN